jgi:hypothetical protein
MRWLRLIVAAPAVLGLAACGQGIDPTSPSSAPSAAPWGDREPVVYSVVVAEVLDDLGSPPPVVFVVDGVCAKAGQVEPSELACEGPMPADGKAALVDLLGRYARVEFVADAEAALGEDGAVREDGLLFWFGPLKDRKGGEVRVGANYARELTGQSLGVNLAMEDQAGSWVVTGAAGLGGCPA